MSHQTVNEAGKATEVALVKFHDGPILIPNGMEIPVAIGVLEARQKWLEETVAIQETFDVFPFDGANAINEVLAAKYGWANSVPTPGFWSDTPPTMLQIEVGYGQKKSVPWGSFRLPNVAGMIQTDVDRGGDRFRFRLTAEVLRKDEATIRDVFKAVREYLKTHSIYRGKAIKIRFLNDAGKPLSMPKPEFMDTSRISRDMIVYSDHIHDSIETNLFTPIERVDDIMRNGLPVKRAVLLGGTYGTGKTLAATVASRLAVDNGLTYLYVPRADELKLAIEFLKQYQNPASVLFCEDIDRVLAGERTMSMDDILNIVDGIDTKTTHMIAVFTTNDLEAINPAMIRPGRLDSVIEVTPPDAKAVEKLIRVYAGNALPADSDIAMAGKALEGQIPAVIAEVVQRAKLAMLRRVPKGQLITGLSEDAIVESAITMKGQTDLLERLTLAAAKAEPTLGDKMADLVEDVIRDNLAPQLLATAIIDEVNSQ